eukprot:345029-Rhodomonas_salina.1
MIVPYKKQSPVGSACTRIPLGSVSPTPVGSSQKMLRLIQFAGFRFPLAMAIAQCRGAPAELMYLQLF